MRQIKLMVISIIVLIGCSKSTEEQIVEEMTVLNNATDFDFFDYFLHENEILILGEASHGDGKTFKVKSEMVKHLIDNFGYNTIAFEARDFLEMEIINGRTGINSLAPYLNQNNWVRQWSPWGPSQQIQPLVEVAQADQNLKFIGLEPYASRNIHHILIYLKSELAEINAEIFDPQKWDLLQGIHLNLLNRKPDLISSDDYLSYLDYLDENFNHLKQLGDNQKNNHILFLLQSVENLHTYVKISQIHASDLPEKEALNKIVKLRDKQMAENLMWHKKRNPDAKIIVWMANFHGARDLKNIRFADGNPERYKKFNVFGEHISNTYGDKVFSIAFTSSEGKSKMPYDFEGIEKQIIEPEDNTLEKTLENTNADFGFVNFREIRRTKPSLKEEYFNSIMLGYVNQNGKWLNAFDGLFYVRKQEPAKPIK
ncbi:MAG: erythromycin esterase family protein [Flavobacteriales bacterium]|nr:erythromycin esterase family protein [Flavobacteriales bacterium]